MIVPAWSQWPWPMTIATSPGWIPRSLSWSGRRPVDAVRHLEVVLLLPAGVVEDDLVSALDDTDVDGQLEEDLVVHRIGAAGTKARSGMKAPAGTSLKTLFRTSHTEYTALGRRGRRAQGDREGQQCDQREDSNHFRHRHLPRLDKCYRL